MSDGSQHGAFVFRLINSCERRFGERLFGHRLVGKGDWRSHFFCKFGEYGCSFGLRFAYHHRHALLDNARLFGGDFFECVAQNVGVVEADIGDDRHHRRNDVGAVEPTAKSHLHNGHIYLFFSEIGECQCGCYLEKRRLHLVDRLPILAHKIDNALFCYHLAIDANPLAKVVQVRRCVESHPIASALQHRRQQVCRGAFAVGACHMYGFVAAVRMPKMCVE